jgi:hypothetical protein
MNLNWRRRQERRAVEEAGGGVSEGFEASEAELIEHASDSDRGSTSAILRDAGRADEEAEALEVQYGEADQERNPD